jgi:peptide deformylase
MSLLDIRVFGDPILRRETELVETITDEHRKLIEDMFETMHAAEGIGLAAPQIGRTERIAVIDIEGERYALVNPEIVASEGSAKAEEGCLSIPEIFADVERPERVTVRALDARGKPYEVAAAALLARCLQHEIDHLHGKLIIDYLSMLKRRSALNKWEKVRNDYPNLIRKVSAKPANEEEL